MARRHKRKRKNKLYRKVKLIFWLLVMLLGLLAYQAYVSLTRPFVQSNVPAPAIQTTGTGAALNYVVMGDSLAAGAGGNYQQGIALATSKYLAKNHQVTMTNLAGAAIRSDNVISDQLAKAAKLKPDLVLLVMGGDDLAHLVLPSKWQLNLERIIVGLRKDNCQVRIVVTGAPALGTSPRFAFPLRVIVGLASDELNRRYIRTIQQSSSIFANVASTGQTFSAHPEDYASDGFHPSTQGYDVLVNAIDPALGKAIASQDHCPVKPSV